MSGRQVVILMIQAAPPKRPPCFESDDAWKGWLINAHVSGLKIVRRSDVGKWGGIGARITSYRLLPTSQIPYCTDCRSVYREMMEARGRCMPCAVPIEREGKTEPEDEHEPSRPAEMTT